MAPKWWFRDRRRSADASLETETAASPADVKSLMGEGQGELYMRMALLAVSDVLEENSKAQATEGSDRSDGSCSSDTAIFASIRRNSDQYPLQASCLSSPRAFSNSLSNHAIKLSAPILSEMLGRIGPEGLQALDRSSFEASQLLERGSSSDMKDTKARPSAVVENCPSDTAIPSTRPSASHPVSKPDREVADSYPMSITLPRARHAPPTQPDPSPHPAPPPTESTTLPRARRASATAAVVPSLEAQQAFAEMTGCDPAATLFPGHERRASAGSATASPRVHKPRRQSEGGIDMLKRTFDKNPKMASASATTCENRKQHGAAGCVAVAQRRVGCCYLPPDGRWRWGWAAGLAEI
ncbi:hypothetical protein HDU96_008375 [Phlyctochytrium bullatum]|nr:hypothetical protein HDU96_008375 [Phlyctochytrium bullatum]